MLTKVKATIPLIAGVCGFFTLLIFAKMIGLAIRMAWLSHFSFVKVDSQKLIKKFF